MIMIGIAAMLAAASSEADLRRGFVECLSNAVSEAKAKQVATDGFVAFARTNCQDSLTPLQAWLVKTDISHGMSKKEAAADADAMLNDYLDEYLDRYKFQLSPGGAPQP